MKFNIIFFAVLIFISSQAKAQHGNIEKSNYGIQTGLLGLWGYNEAKLSNKFALRTEVGFDTGFFGGSYYDRTGVVFTPVITAEPRWYYNLAKRNRKGKNTIHNSANFLTLRISYNPDWFTISNYDNVRVVDQISFIPEWGIKRSIGKHIAYELGIGIGYRYYFLKQYGFRDNEGELAGNLHIRIGYAF